MQLQWQIQSFSLVGDMASAGARAYNGGLGAEPPAGSRGRAPGHGVRGEALLKLKSFFHWNVQRRGYSRHFSCSVGVVDGDNGGGLQFRSFRVSTLQGCGLGLDVSVSRRSRDVPTSRLGLVSTKILNVSVSSRSRPLTSRARDQSAKFYRSR